MLRIIESFNNFPSNFEFDQRATFQPGQIASFKIVSGKPKIVVCDGLYPVGLIDDIKSKVLRCIPNPPLMRHIAPVREDILSEDHQIELEHANIISASFTCSINVILDAVRGIVTIPKGTCCVDKNICFTCAYAYNTAYDTVQDSTLASKRITIWSKNMIAETDMYDTTQMYKKYSNLYVEKGLLTTKRVDPQCKCIGMVLISPYDNDNPSLRFLLDIEGKVDVSQNGTELKIDKSMLDVTSKF